MRSESRVRNSGKLRDRRIILLPSKQCAVCLGISQLRQRRADMKRIFVLTFVVIGLVGCGDKQTSGSRDDTVGFSAADETAVRSVVSDFVKTWNQHDMKAM